MKFNELFDKKMMLNWKKISNISEFIALKKRKSGNTNILDITHKITDRMFDYLDNVDMCSRNSERYIILMTASLLNSISYSSKNSNLTLTRNMIRKMFYDEDVILREKVCHLISSLYLNFNSVLPIKSIIKLSYCLVSIDEILLFAKIFNDAKMNDPKTSVIFDNIEKTRHYANDCLKCLDNQYIFDNRLQRQQCFYPNFKYDGYYAEPKFNVYVMIGIPGSGKSTWIKNNLPKDIKILCRDTIRTEIGIPGEKPMGNKEQESEVTRIFNRRMIDYAKKNIDFVIDNTNVKRKYRNAYHDMILEYNPKFIYVFVEAPSVNDNKKRRDGQMNESVIDDMLMNLEFPAPFEYDKLIIHKQK